MNGGRRRPRARALSTWISVVALLALVTALGRPAATLAFILLKDMSDQAGSLSAALNFNASALEGCRNIRWDADYSRNPHPGMPPVYVPVCADLSPAELRSLHQFRERQTSTPFSIVFTCTDVTEAICQKAKLGFEKAGKRIAQALKIDTTIVVQATFKSFCEGQGASCALRNTLGQAQASSYLQGKIGDDGPWLFPQALFKQINSGAQVQLKEVDIIAEFNTDFKFWFEGDGSISSEQVDFELVVAHEYAHG